MQPSNSTLLGRFLLPRSKRHLRCCSKLLVHFYFFSSLWSSTLQPFVVQFFRSLFGFVFPLFGQPMFDKLGLGGGNSVRFCPIIYLFRDAFIEETFEKQLLAGFAIAVGIPFPIWIYYNGEGLRARNPLTKVSTIPKRIS